MMAPATLTQNSTKLQELIARRRPGWCLERDFYVDPEVFKVDMEKVFMKYWLYAGHTSRIPTPGDYFMFHINDVPLAIMRGRDMQVRALVDVCRHRGSRMCLKPEGHMNSIVCPYHQWVYDLDGNLKSARMMERELYEIDGTLKTKALPFDMKEFGMHQAACKVVEGLIFVCLAKEPPDFSAAEADLKRFLQKQGIAEAKIARAWRYPAEANWKLISENFRECYHCDDVHPQYVKAVPYVSVNRPADSVPEIQAHFARQESRWKAMGLGTGIVPSSPDAYYTCMRAPLREGFVTESMDGKPVAPLMGSLPDADAGAVGFTLYPNFWMEANSDHAMVMNLVPASATHCEMETSWLVNSKAVEGKDYDVEKLSKFYWLTLEQDRVLVNDEQAGVNSRFYEPGPYAPSEIDCERFVQWYLKQISA
jgi:Rieske 2Fe-2S family protein